MTARAPLVIVPNKGYIDDSAILARYKPHAKKIGAQLTGKIMRAFIGKAREICILVQVKNQYGTDWIKGTALAQGTIPRKLKNGTINQKSVNNQIQKVKTACKKYDCTFTGNHKRHTNGARIFELKRKGITHWRLLGDLERGDTGFAPIIRREQSIKEVQIVAKQRGFIFTKEVKQDVDGTYYFGIRLPYSKDVRFTNKSDLKSGVNPFNNFFQNKHGKFSQVQIDRIHLLAKKVGDIFTGKYKFNRNEKNINKPSVQLERNGIKKWIGLASLQHGSSPFTMNDLATQKKLAHQYTLENFGEDIVFTGKTRQGKNWKEFLLKHLIKKDLRWTSLGSIKEGHNPWKATFDAAKPAVFYVVPLNKNGRTVIGYGITNIWKQRKLEHNAQLRKGGWSVITEEKLFHFKKGKDARALEVLVKSQFPLAKIDVLGFRSEATTISQHKKLLAFAVTFGLCSRSGSPTHLQ